MHSPLSRIAARSEKWPWCPRLGATRIGTLYVFLRRPGRGRGGSHHNLTMRPEIHDALAYCRYEQDRCAYSISVSKALRELLSQRLALMVLERSKNARIRKKLIEDRVKLAQHSRVLVHGRSAKYLV